jgi:hypothetical protein
VIYQLTAPTLPVLDADIFGLLPKPEWGLGLWVAGFALLLLCIGFAAFQRYAPRVAALVIPSLLFAGGFIHGFGLIDEVSVNLEHPFNLLHHGFFSMQPDSWRDGTVEFFFYLLHAPFASSPKILVFGNFLICFLVGWLHLFALWKAKLFEGKLHGLLPLSFIACCFHFIGLTSNGFGNGLLSLVFLLAFISQVKGRPVLSLFIGALLPLLRPEGAIWAGINIAAVFLTTPHRMRLFGRPAFYLGLIAPLISSALYFGLYKIFYGHFIPTPMLFKETALSSFAKLDFAKIQLGMNAITEAYPIIYFVFAAAIFVLLPVYRQIQKREDNYLKGLVHAFSRKVMNWLMRGQVQEIIIFMGYFVVTALPLGAWVLTNFSYTNPIDRYYIVFFLCLVLLLAKLLTLALSDVALSNAFGFYFGEQTEKRALHLRYLGWAGVFVFIAFTFPHEKDAKDAWLYNRAHMALAGAATEKLVPKEYKLAASEMNTFGLMLDRPILDLWGYSNRTIASSNTCARVNIKAVPGLFLQLQPDIYFTHAFTEFPDKENFDTVEDSFMQSFHSHGNIFFSRIADLKDVFKAYDVVIATFPSLQLAYVVRNDLTKNFIKNLEGQGLSLQKSRAIKPAVFEKYEPFRQFHPC